MSSIKVLILTVVKHLATIAQNTTSRFLIKNFVSPKELPFWKWFSWTFIKSLTMSQIGALLGIASFTIVSFPLGVWLSSFSAGLFYPLFGLYTTAVGMFMIPFSLWSLHKTVGEITFNNQTIMGLFLVEVASIIAIVGWFMIFRGNQP